MNKVLNILRASINLLAIAFIWLIHISVPLVSCLVVIIINLIKQEDGFNIKEYIVEVLYSQDQLVNTILCGTPDTTISGRVGYWSLQGDEVAGYMEKVINLLFFFQPNHCQLAIEDDEDHGKPFII